MTTPLKTSRGGSRKGSGRKSNASKGYSPPASATFSMPSDKLQSLRSKHGLTPLGVWLVSALDL